MELSDLASGRRRRYWMWCKFAFRLNICIPAQAVRLHGRPVAMFFLTGLAWRWNRRAVVCCLIHKLLAHPSNKSRLQKMLWHGPEIQSSSTCNRPPRTIDPCPRILFALLRSLDIYFVDIVGCTEAARPKAMKATVGWVWSTRSHQLFTGHCKTALVLPPSICSY